MRIVDSQVHIWAASTPERPWPGRHAPQREIPLGHEELLSAMDQAGVDAAVLVPPSWEGDRNDLVLAAARAHPQRFAVMGRLDPDASASRGQLASWRDQTGMLGLRFSLRRPGMDDTIERGSLDWLWGEAERHGVPIMILLPQTALHQIDRIASRYPGLRLVIDHLAVPSLVPAAERFTHIGKLLALAKHTNVAVKASALPCFAQDAYPYVSLHPHVRRIVGEFGPRRVFWGTDFSRLRGSYREAITMFTEEMPWLSEDDKAWIMGRGLCEWLGWTLAGTFSPARDGCASQHRTFSRSK